MKKLLNQLPAKEPKTNLPTTDFKYQFLNLLILMKDKGGDKQAEAIGDSIMFYNEHKDDVNAVKDEQPDMEKYDEYFSNRFNIKK